MVFLSILVLLAPLAATLNLTTAYASPDGSFLENLVVDSSNRILVTSSTSNTILRIDTSGRTSSAASYITVKSPSDINSVLPIREFIPGHFTLAADDLNLTTLLTAKDWHVYTLDTTRSPPVLHDVASGFLNTSYLNGMSVLDSAGPGVVLIGDSIAGVIWRVDLYTSAQKIVIRGEALTLDPSTPNGTTPLGVNGIEVYNGKLFFTNSQRGTFGYIPIKADGTQAGPATILARDVASGFYDDFAILGPKEVSAQGKQDTFALITRHPDSIIRVDWGNGSATQREFIDARLGPGGPTSLAYGRGEQNITVYVTTENGKLFSFDVKETRGLKSVRRMPLSDHPGEPIQARLSANQYAQLPSLVYIR